MHARVERKLMNGLMNDGRLRFRPIDTDRTIEFVQHATIRSWKITSHDIARRVSALASKVALKSDTIRQDNDDQWKVGLTQRPSANFEVANVPRQQRLESIAPARRPIGRRCDDVRTLNQHFKAGPQFLLQ